MSGKPWLSIVIPAYNAERYLDDCVTSINPKECSDVQVILVDDGSTDSTPRICDQLADRHKNLMVIHRENGGSPSARNAGCARADGNWIWFVDSDDMIAPYAIDALRDVCTETEADAVQIRFLEFSDGKNPAWPASIPPVRAIALAADEFLAGIYRGEFGHYMCSFLLRSDALLGRNGRRSRPFREDFSLYEDVVSTEDFVRRAWRIDVLELEVYGYRQVSSSMTHKKSNKAADSGLRAVLELQKYDAPDELAADKARMELSLLFSAYKLVEDGADSQALKQRFDVEIRQRAKTLGLFGMDTQRLVRYMLYRTGAMNLITEWRLRHG